MDKISLSNFICVHELGPEHPLTQQSARLLAQTQEATSGVPPGTRALGTLIGLASKPVLYPYRAESHHLARLSHNTITR
jgi:hypothetical protein